MRNVSVLIRLVLVTVAVLHGQPAKKGDSPYDSLNPKTLESLSKSEYGYMIEKMGDFQMQVFAKLTTFQNQSNYIQQQQQIVLEHLNQLLSLQSQMSQATERLNSEVGRMNSLEERLKRLEENQMPQPGNIAVLNTKVDIVLSALGSALLVLAGIAANRLHQRHKMQVEEHNSTKAAHKSRHS